jgi:hypothetical protein
MGLLMTAASVPIKTRKRSPTGWTVVQAMAQLEETEWTIRGWIRTGRLVVVSGGGQGKQTRVRPVDPAAFERTRLPRGRPPRDTPVSKDDYARAVTKYGELEAQNPLRMSGDEWKRVAADLCSSHDEARARMDHASRQINALRRWPEDASGPPWPLLGLAGSAEALLESTNRLAMLMLTDSALTLEYGPRQWVSRVDRTDPDGRMHVAHDMHVAHVLELAGASASQIAQELGISTDSVKALKRRWRRGDWRRIVAARYLDRMDEAYEQLGWEPMRRPRSLKEPRTK